ncbi:MAG: SDR family oxidoreductase [Planctomycetota bacterium]|jgi:NAD(P)-dependent dehydrogenase (short-subunit alcohol dehydrogenase family)/rhamnose utilization protein RhaD (predicted bifunctional aldolase and dehydrogenase)
MNKALADLIRISKATGKDTELVQGGGGNTSVKTADGKHMYIKASGTALKDMTSQSGWRRLRIDKVLSVIGDKQLAGLDSSLREPEVVRRLLHACDDDVESGARPSVEAHLHAMLDKYVIHLHPVVIAAYANARNGRIQFEKLFSDAKFPPLWIAYTDPGFKLAKKLAKLTEGYKKEHGRKPSVIVLEKHGLIVTAGAADSALKLVHQVVNRCGKSLKKTKKRAVKSPNANAVTDARLAIRKSLFEVAGEYLPVSYFPPRDSIAAFMSRKDARKLLAVSALNPDELLYANGPAMWLESCDADTVIRRLKSLIDKGQRPSSAFLVKNVGLFVASEMKLASIIAGITGGSLFVRSHAADFGGVLSLTKREQDFINNWESEAFRKNLVTGLESGRLKNRIAVVSGAGSGLGRSLAIGLARAGAMVALLDIDSKAAGQTKALIEKENKGAQVLDVKCDITKQSAVENAFAKVLEDWGGLDILVNAAGVAPAYSLVEMPVDKWRAALEVNLTGYFLLAREAARIMIGQGMGGNIINLSSKSGLQASVDNTAYNATKAGEIHMARGWALELGKHGIRVNSVAPGNVFEGSKIWNRQYIKTAAKKYGIKPEEVIPYYVNKTALKKEIKGQDVADAVVFLCSDNARNITGQTLVVDSGQAMVR